MNHPHDLPEGAFPFLPGEHARLPGVEPAQVWSDRADLPPWIVLTLTCLRDGATPQVLPPAEWRQATEESDEFNQMMRGFADEQLHLSSVGRQEPVSGEDRLRIVTTWIDKKTRMPVEEDKAWQLTWSGYAKALLADLARFNETPSEALGRLHRHWAQYQHRREQAFLAEFTERDAWTPGMSAAWIMFGGHPEWVARYLGCNADAPFSGMELLAMASTVRERIVEHIVDRQPADTLLKALRRSTKSPTRVIAKGLLEGRGLLVEITPADLSRMVWDVNSADANILLRDDWTSTNRTTVFAGVVIDRESLFRAFPSVRPNEVETVTAKASKRRGRKPTASEPAERALRAIVKKHGEEALNWTVPALQQTAKDEHQLVVKETTMRTALKAVSGRS